MISLSGSTVKRGLAACIFIAAAGVFYTKYQDNALGKQLESCKAYDENPETAIQVCTELLSNARLSASQKQAALLQFRGRAYADMKDWPNALADFERVLALYPNTSYSRDWQAHILRKMGDYPAALAAFEKALSLDPSHQYALRQKQFVLRDMERFEEAEANYQTLLVDHPERAWVPRDLGQLYNLQGRYAEAFAQFKSALSIDLSDKKSRSGMHETCVQLEGGCPALFPETREARSVKSCDAALSEALEILPDDPKMQFALQNPNTAWIIATSLYTSAAVVLTNRSSDETANRLILFDRLMNCTEDGYEAGLLSEHIEQSTELQEQLETIFSPPVRENLLDLAYAQLNQAE